jgi:hypothetical protein
MGFKKLITIILALFVTGTAITMAALASMDRGGSTSDKALLVMMSAALAALVHLLPAISKNRLVRFLWTGCFIATTYSCLTFFTNASVRAGEVRAQNSLGSLDVERQILTIKNERDSITTRSVTEITAGLSVTQDWKTRVMLKNELNEAKRRIVLTEQLIELNNEAKNTHVTESNDRVTALLSRVTGSSDAQISLVIGLALAVLIDFAGVMLWREILLQSDVSIDKETEIVADVFTSIQPTESVPVAIELPADQIICELQQAIANGVCKPTVSAIRVFAGCGQARASELRKRLLQS